jgi:hypothetical protein
VAHAPRQLASAASKPTSVFKQPTVHEAHTAKTTERAGRSIAANDKGTTKEAEHHDGLFESLENAAAAVVHHATSSAKVVVEHALEIEQELPYGVYYVSYTALDQAQQHDVELLIPLQIHAALLLGEAVGLGGNAAFNLARQKSIWDDARRDSVLPNFVARRWNPGFLIWYLPGIGTDHTTGRHKIDFQW